MAEMKVIQGDHKKYVLRVVLKNGISMKGDSYHTGFPCDNHPELSTYPFGGV